MIIVFAWMIIPVLVQRALQVAYLSNALDRINLTSALRISFICAKIIGTVIALSFWARSLELCYPDTFDPYHEKHR